MGLELYKSSETKNEGFKKIDLKIRLTLDSKKKLITKEEVFSGGKMVSETTYLDLAKSGNIYYYKKATTRNRKGVITNESFSLLNSIKKINIGSRLSSAINDFKKELLFEEKKDMLLEVEQIIKDGKGSFSHYFTLFVKFAKRQQWKKADKYFDKIANMAKDKRGLEWLKVVYLNEKRNFGKLKQDLIILTNSIKKDEIVSYKAANLLSDLAS